MAIKVTNQIGTSGGITTEAYIRIGTYLIDKSNNAVRFGLEIYNTESDKTNKDNIVINKQIGSYVYKKVSSFSSFDSTDIFTAGYSELRTHLQSIYGPSSTIDC
jgi:hypothetical protein